MSPSPWAGVNPSEWYDVRQWWHSHMCGDTTQTTGLYNQNWPTGGTDCMNYNYHESLDTGSFLATYLPICQQVSTHECVYLFLVYFFYTIQLATVWHGSLWLLAGLVIVLLILYSPSTQPGPFFIIATLQLEPQSYHPKSKSTPLPSSVHVENITAGSMGIEVKYDSQQIPRVFCHGDLPYCLCGPQLLYLVPTQVQDSQGPY